MSRSTSPTNLAVWVRQLAAELRSQGYPVADLLAEAGLSEDDLAPHDARIPFVKHAAFFELAAKATGDSCLGFHFAQTRSLRDAGLVGYLGLASPILLDGLKNLARYMHVASEAVTISIDALEACGEVRWSARGLPSPKPTQCLEFAGTQIFRVMRDVTGRRLTPVSASFAHQRSGDIEAFEHYFGCPVKFGCWENIVELKPADLRLPLKEADDRLVVLLRGLCDDILSRNAELPVSLTDRLAPLITDRLSKGEAKLELVARELGMSPRSLSRRLAEADTSFNRIVEDLRRELSSKYLHESELGVTQISFLLGYSDVSSFNHAFKRWTGQTPSAFRREMAARL